MMADGRWQVLQGDLYMQIYRSIVLEKYIGNSLRIQAAPPPACGGLSDVVAADDAEVKVEGLPAAGAGGQRGPHLLGAKIAKQSIVGTVLIRGAAGRQSATARSNFEAVQTRQSDV
jgi:hypothetical protein